MSLKLSTEDIRDAYLKWKNNVYIIDLAIEYQVNETTMSKYIRQYDIGVIKHYTLEDLENAAQES